MIICSALYYPGSLVRGAEGLVRDNRYYPGKAVETFPVWWQYVRKHYPDVEVVLFADRHSPVPVGPLLDSLGEPWEDVDAYGRRYPSPDEIDTSTNEEDYERRRWRETQKALRSPPRVRVRWLDAFAGQYFRPMQRNLVQAIIAAYSMNEDLLYLDNDAFLNTDIRPLVRDYDVAASGLAAHQMTMDSVCTFISARRLHALDELGIDLPSFLTTMLNEGPTETRMHTLQEGGLYKLFAYGKVRSLGRDIELTHLSCYDRFMTWLRRNPLDTPEYRSLVAQLEGLDMTKLEGVEMRFHDMLYPENAIHGG